MSAAALDPCDALGRYDTPFGPLAVGCRDGLISSIRFCWDEPVGCHGEDPALDRFAQQLADYLDGAPVEFDLPLAWGRLQGVQHDVLRATALVAHGETTTYGRIATAIGRAGQARAVGGALRTNPWVLVVPCHRVLAADGALTGYGGGPQTGGRLDVKAALLAHERAWSHPTLFG